MTQITVFKPLEDGVSEYVVLSCPKKDHNHLAYFLRRNGVLLYREIWIFTSYFNYLCPKCYFYTPKITNLAENRGEKVKNICPIFNQIR